MFKIDHYDLCIVGSGAIADSLLQIRQFKESRKLIISNQLFGWPDQRRILENFATTSREDFINEMRPITIDTLIISAKPYLWPRQEDFDSLLHKLNLSVTGKVIILSSGSVYGETGLSAVEESNLRPVNEYGRRKLREEERVAHFFNVRRSTLILRLSNIYGDRAFQDIINRSIDSALNNRPIEVFAYGTLYRDFLPIEDVTQCIVGILNTVWSTDLMYLNVSSGKGTPISHLITLVSEILSSDITQLDRPRPSDVVLNSILDNSKIRNFIPWSPQSLEVGLKKYISNHFPESNASR